MPKFSALRMLQTSLEFFMLNRILSSLLLLWTHFLSGSRARSSQVYLSLERLGIFTKCVASKIEMYDIQSKYLLSISRIQKNKMCKKSKKKSGSRETQLEGREFHIRVYIVMGQLDNATVRVTRWCQVTFRKCGYTEAIFSLSDGIWSVSVL